MKPMQKYLNVAVATGLAAASITSSAQTTSATEAARFAAQ
jgi:hypothetical protein